VVFTAQALQAAQGRIRAAPKNTSMGACRRHESLPAIEGRLL